MLSLEFFPIRAHQTSDSPRSTIEIHSLAVWLQSPYSSPCRRETSPAFESEPRASLPTPADPPSPSQGFSYGLLDTLNKHFQNSLNITRARSSGLQAAYFGAYPLASLGHANWILRHYGYKATFIWGLCLYGVGSLVAWPCILYRSFGGFCAAIFIIGNGLGSLETAANPYITVCGPPKYSEIRINFSQAFNG